uniref:2,3-bisphosphoglycerate-independent phosphoglycerate mutase n=1 Tax=Anotrichium furcellatum TaxID=41999 RepID=A0A4D6WN14_9FLOR|nr:Phosphoglycerate mutase [Anotrichium furcellatum]
MNNQNICPIVLTILDGWGYSEYIKGNAIKLAATPTMDFLWKYYPHTLLNASGKDVGLPNQQMGNSEVGHTTIGAGRIISQDLVRIQKSINNQTFSKNPIIHSLCQYAQDNKSKLHIIGLCSDGGVHSHIDHLHATINLIKQYSITTCLHLITDGRDTAPKEAVKFITEIYNQINSYDNINICSISGRYYSMDRDCRWSRTEKTYKILTENHNKIKYPDNNLEQYIKIIQQYYEEGISDEFIPPTKTNQLNVDNQDCILFVNFRPDRTRQLLHAFAKDNFKGFKRIKLNGLKFATFTNYDSSLNIPIVFPQETKNNFLGQIISQNNLKQLRLAETEKYAHVTYFFNGGIEEPFPGEDRELISSPKVETYDLSPDMSAKEITKSAINAINKNIYTLIIINYANTDMVGHTGNLESTIQSVQTVDLCLKELLNKIQEVQGTLLITADHGNAEYMLDKNNKPCKSHSTNLVPFIIINHMKKSYNLKALGSLADIAPTILELLKIKTPEQMNGQSLLQKSESS